MIKKLLALALALTMCFGTTITANAAMNISNEMGALNTHNILDINSSKIPKGTLQYMASKFKIEYTQEDLKAFKKDLRCKSVCEGLPGCRCGIWKRQGSSLESLCYPWHK